MSLDGSAVGLPAVQVTANGSPVDGVLEIDVSSNSYLGADRYRLVVALQGNNFDPWQDDSLFLRISLSGQGMSQTLISGMADRVDLDLGAKTVTVDGRDLTSRFIEARTQETFENRTASEIVSLLAMRRGLDSQVAPTDSLVGRYYDGSHSRVTLDQFSHATTEWDLLARLAETEGCDIWVDDTTLNFAPLRASPPSITLTAADCISLSLTKSLPLAANLQVVVRSWDSAAQQAVVQTATSPALADATSRSYVIVEPNLSATDAANLASRVLTQIRQHLRVVAAELPGETLLKPRQCLQLAGTGTDFDGTYVITGIDRHLSYEHGFTETLQARTPPWTTS